VPSHDFIVLKILVVVRKSKFIMKYLQNQYYINLMISCHVVIVSFS